MVILFAGRRIEAENLPLDIRRGSGARHGESGRFVLPESGIRLQDLEVDMIRQALAMAGGNKSRAARLLGLTRDTLLYRMQKYVIQA
jgi:DNA-binding NtrC family response regulator